MKNKSLILSLFILLTFKLLGESVVVFSPQTTLYYYKRQTNIAIKSNILYDLSSTFNISAEFKLSDNLTLDFPFNYNPWTFSNNKKIKHLLVQPELRYWLYEPFNGHFLGSHLSYSLYNIGGIGFTKTFLPDLQTHRYEGELYGLGVAYGYHWFLNPKFSLEATLGCGYAYLFYEQYQCIQCGDKIADKTKHYLGITKAGISIIYHIK